MCPPEVVVAVLAAGASRRLGRDKQLLRLDGQALVRRQCRCALASGVGEVVAILGCHAEQHRREIEDLPVDVRVNDEWDEGLAATLRCAVGAARSKGRAVLVLACDQYRVVPNDLRELYRRWCLMPSTAFVSRSGTYAGPPAILPARYHDQILRLRGDRGARSLLYRDEWPRPGEVVNPRSSFDIDSPEDASVAQAWAEASSACPESEWWQ